MDNRRISWFVPPLILIIIIIAVNIVYYRKRSRSLKRIVIKQDNREYSQENQEKIAKKATIVPLKESLPKAQKEQKKHLSVAKGKKFAIQVASFRKKKRALEFVESLKKDNYLAYIVAKNLGDKGTWYRVRIGNFSSKSDADSVLKEVKTKYLQSFITSYISP